MLIHKNNSVFYILQLLNWNPPRLDRNFHSVEHREFSEAPLKQSDNNWQLYIPEKHRNPGELNPPVSS